ncbi:MAG: hypothetical protein EOP89_13590, partial [Lysobacteraceae bacterium]
MDWQQWLRGMGVPVPESPDTLSIALAVMLVVGAYWIGWFLGRRLARPIGATIRRLTGRTDQFGTSLAQSLTHYGMTTLLLLVASNLPGFSALAVVILAFALAV